MTGAVRTPWPVIGVLCFAGLAAAFQIGKVSAALPLVMAEFGVGVAVGSWLVALYSLVSAALGMFAGLVADRLGARRIAALGLFIIAAASVAGAAAPGYAFLLAARLVEGLGLIMAVTALPGLITRAAAAPDRGLALGLWGAYMPGGLAIMLLLAPGFIALGGWRLLWLGNGALAALAGLWLLAITRGGAEAPRTALSAVSVLQVLRARGVLALGACFGAYAFQFIAVMGLLPVLLIQVAGLGASHAAWATAAVVTVNAVGSIASGWLLGRGLKAGDLIATACVVMAVCEFAIYAAEAPLWLRLGAAALLSFAGGLVPGACFASMPRHTPAPGLISAANGAMMQGSQIGQFIGPPLLGLAVSQFGGWTAAPAVLAAAAGLTLVLALWLRRLERG